MSGCRAGAAAHDAVELVAHLRVPAHRVRRGSREARPRRGRAAPSPAAPRAVRADSASPLALDARRRGAAAEPDAVRGPANLGDEHARPAAPSGVARVHLAEARREHDGLDDGALAARARAALRPAAARSCGSSRDDRLAVLVVVVGRAVRLSSAIWSATRAWAAANAASSHGRLRRPPARASWGPCGSSTPRCPRARRAAAGRLHVAQPAAVPVSAPGNGAIAHGKLCVSAVRIGSIRRAAARAARRARRGGRGAAVGRGRSAGRGAAAAAMADELSWNAMTELAATRAAGAPPFAAPPFVFFVGDGCAGSRGFGSVCFTSWKSDSGLRAPSMSCTPPKNQWRECSEFDCARSYSSTSVGSRFSRVGPNSSA